MRSRVAVIDYGMGNLHSVAKALEHVANDQHEIIVTAEPDIIRSAERIVFPGVGAIRDCMAEIRRLDIDTLITQAIAEEPVLAVCVGMLAVLHHSDATNDADCIRIVSWWLQFFGSHLSNSAGDI